MLPFCKVFIRVLPFLAFCAFSLLGQALSQTVDSRRNVSVEVRIKSLGYNQEGMVQALHQAEETQFLLVTEDFEGRLFIGREVPSVAWYRTYLLEEGYLAGPVVFRNVGTSLVVRPRVIGNQIEVTLTPEISYETEDGRGTIAVKKLSTTVRVPSGQSMEIGAGMKNSEFENNFYRRETGEVVRIILTPRIVETS